MTTTLRCSSALLKHLGTAATDVRPTGLLGDWCAKPIRFRARRLTLCTNQRSLLSVVVPMAPTASFLDRFGVAAQDRINQLSVAASFRLNEIAGLRDLRLGKATNRSVLSTMTQLAFDAEAWLDGQRPDKPVDLDALGFRLCDTPCSALSTHWPWLEAELILTGSIAPGHRGLRSSTHVI